MSKSAICVYDFRSNYNDFNVETLKSLLKQIAKKWVFQHEKGDSGYEHWQGRLSLIKARRKPELMKLIQGLDYPIFNYLEPTVSQESQKTAFYCMKADTRIDGPYQDDDKEIYIPRQYRGFMNRLRPFQQYIKDSVNTFEPRIINLIYCPDGDKGKSVIAALMELLGKGIDLPPVNDAKELIQTMCDICMAKKERVPNPVFIDLPRAMEKSRLFGIYTAIEQFKKGKLYDLRYAYKEWWIDSPQIFVFQNVLPNFSYLSKDRWRIWTINDEYELIQFDSIQSQD